MTARTRSTLRVGSYLAAAIFAASLIAMLLAAVARPQIASGATLDAPPEVHLAPMAPAVEPAPAPAPWRRGDNIAAGLLVLGVLLRAGLRLDPKRSALYAAGLATLGGCIDLAANGQTPNLSMLLGALAAFGFWLMGSPLPPRPPRKAEAGSVAGRVLFWLACIAVGCAIGASLACSGAKHTARATSAAVVDCTAETFRAGAERYAGRVRDAVVRCGDDWGCVGDAVAELGQEVGLEVAGCAALRVVTGMLAPSVAPVDRGRIEAGWDRVRIERLGGVRFEDGAVKP